MGRFDVDVAVDVADQPIDLGPVRPYSDVTYVNHGDSVTLLCRTPGIDPYAPLHSKHFKLPGHWFGVEAVNDIKPEAGGMRGFIKASDVDHIYSHAHDIPRCHITEIAQP